MKKEIWIQNNKTKPLIRTVIFEKTRIDKDIELCLYINGVEVFVIKEEYDFLQPNKFGKPKMYGGKEKTPLEKNTLVGIVVWNYPIESVMTDNEIFWRLSKFVFRAKAYKDYINNKIVINN
jgi:hypothetical protein